MANVTDVSGSGEPDAAVLTETASSGVFGGSFLRSQPLLAYLDDDEVPQFVLRNKRGGLEVEPGTDPVVGSAADGSGVERERADGTADEKRPTDDLEPAREYQALAAITDVRVVFVVGTADGDRSVTVPLAEVAAVDVESGLVGNGLAITTATNDRYVFPCRGDLAPVAEYVDLGTQAWTRAYSLLADAQDHLAAAERLCAGRQFVAAIEAIDAAEAAVADAQDRAAAFGEGARASLAPEADDVGRTIGDRRREIHAEHGVAAHERAREYWGNRQYERAHEAYLEARAALERAQELEATEGIDARLDRIDRELRDLADAPLSYARAMVEEAEASDDARTTAQCWEVAIERFRDVYALDWGRSDERFSGDPTAIRERILSAVDELVDHRTTGIRDRLDEAEWLRQSDDIAGAVDVLDDAEATLDRTERIVDELTHADYPELDEIRREVEADRTVLPSL